MLFWCASVFAKESVVSVLLFIDRTIGRLFFIPFLELELFMRLVVNCNVFVQSCKLSLLLAVP